MSKTSLYYIKIIFMQIYTCTADRSILCLYGFDRPVSGICQRTPRQTQSLFSLFPFGFQLYFMTKYPYPYTGTTLSDRWTYLRNHYTKVRRDIRNKKSGSAGGTTPKWPLFDILHFLEPHVKERNTSSNFAPPPTGKIET